ncbi:hypothetical protein D047_3591A, partial [Vibrio parahaemolyticus VPTS-2010_2]|jgi:hypothetical protein
MIK